MVYPIDLSHSALFVAVTNSSTRFFIIGVAVVFLAISLTSLAVVVVGAVSFLGPRKNKPPSSILLEEDAKLSIVKPQSEVLLIVVAFLSTRLRPSGEKTLFLGNVAGFLARFLAAGSVIGVCRGEGGDGVYVVTVIDLAFGLSIACVNSPDPLRFLPPSSHDDSTDDSEETTSSDSFEMERSLLILVMNSPDGLRVRGLLGGRGLREKERWTSIGAFEEVVPLGGVVFNLLVQDISVNIPSCLSGPGPSREHQSPLGASGAFIMMLWSSGDL